MCDKKSSQLTLVELVRQHWSMLHCPDSPFKCPAVSLLLSVIESLFYHDLIVHFIVHSTPSIFFSTCIGREGVWWSRKRDVLGLTALYNMMCLLYLIDWDGLSWAVADRPAVRWWKTPTPSCTSGIAIKATGWKTTASSSFFLDWNCFSPFSFTVAGLF